MTICERHRKRAVFVSSPSSSWGPDFQTIHFQAVRSLSGPRFLATHARAALSNQESTRIWQWLMNPDFNFGRLCNLNRWILQLQDAGQSLSSPIFEQIADPVQDFEGFRFRKQWSQIHQRLLGSALLVGHFEALLSERLTRLEVAIRNPRSAAPPVKWANPPPVKTFMKMTTRVVISGLVAETQKLCFSHDRQSNSSQRAPGSPKDLSRSSQPSGPPSQPWINRRMLIDEEVCNESWWSSNRQWFTVHRSRVVGHPFNNR